MLVSPGLIPCTPNCRLDEAGGAVSGREPVPALSERARIRKYEAWNSLRRVIAGGRTAVLFMATLVAIRSNRVIKDH